MTPDLWTVFSETARTHGPKDALVRGESRVTFDACHRRARQYAAALRARGVGPRDRVLFWMHPSAEMAAAMFGVWALGGIAALMDTDERGAHLEHAVRTIAPAAIVADPDAPLAHTDHPIDVQVLRFEPAELERVDTSGFTPHRTLSIDPASIVFTSGSTGMPKGVTQSHGNLVRACRSVASYLGLTPGDRIICPIPWAFDYGYGQLLSSAVLGATQILPTALNPFAICEAIGAHRPTVLPVIPSILTYLLRGVSPFRQTDISSIRLVTNTGGAIPGPILEEAFDIFDRADIVLNYGLTETYRTAFLPPSLTRRHPTSIGGGIPGVEVIIVRDDGSRADAGEEGQIVHRGDYVCMGYWGNREATAKAVRPDPLEPADCPNPRPAFYTGDNGVIDADGLLYFTGRRDRLMKSMGVRVSPTEIEELLYQSGLVREVGVFGVPNELSGDEICAAIVPATTEDRVDVALGRYARATMNQYMIPRRVFVKDVLPKTRTGKIDYPALKAEALGAATTTA